MALSDERKVVALVGGVGGAKLAFGLARLLPPDQLSFVVNTADDFSLYGLHVSPDLDTVMYTLAGLANPVTGWGLDGDTTHMLDMLRCYGEDVWFTLGDRDLATNLLRTRWLDKGASLSEVTGRLCRALGVCHPVLPMTDSPFATLVETVEEGVLAFQEYFVRQRWQPAVRRIWFKGQATALAPEAVCQALAEAALMIFCPSNPLLSIEPILSVPGLRELIRDRAGPAIAVSPFIRGQAVKGPAAKLMSELGWEPSAGGIARYYQGLIDGLVLDTGDEIPPDLNGGLRLLRTDILMQSDADRVRLAREVLDWVEGL